MEVSKPWFQSRGINDRFAKELNYEAPFVSAEVTALS